MMLFCRSTVLPELYGFCRAILETVPAFTKTREVARKFTQDMHTQDVRFVPEGSVSGA